MAPKKYAPFYSIVQRIAASPPGAWLFARTLHHLDAACFRVSGGRATLSSLLAGVPVVTMTTIGAKSGLPRTVPLLCIHGEHDPACFAVIATNWGQRRYPAWYFNLKANPRATCTIAGQAGHYLAHEATGAEYAQYWQAAADTYLGYPLYRQRIQGRSIPIIVMTPQP